MEITEPEIINNFFMFGIGIIIVKKNKIKYANKKGKLYTHKLSTYIKNPPKTDTIITFEGLHILCEIDRYVTFAIIETTSLSDMIYKLHHDVRNELNPIGFIKKPFSGDEIICNILEAINAVTLKEILSSI